MQTSIGLLFFLRNFYKSLYEGVTVNPSSEIQRRINYGTYWKIQPQN